jgi:hypothetical protein
MSKILRRPMFRGGRVDSRGTGITSGLMDEGQIGGGSIYGEQMPDGRYGFQNPMSLEDILKQQLSDIESRRSYEAPKTSQEIEKEYMSKLKPYEEPTFFDPDTGMGAGAPGSYAQGQLDYFQALSSPTYKTAFLTKREKEEAEKRKVGEQLGYKFDPEKYGKNIPTIKETDVVDTNKVISRSTPKTRREEILEEAALYREALGYDDAKSQAIFNALGEAAPAFFKGKNVREAIPQVLESINKSKAFEGPKDIKQAAGQLAIQRRMLADKAKAEELARLAIYGMKSKETLTDFIKGIPGSFSAGLLPKGVEKNPTLQASLRPGGIYSTTEGDFFYAVPSAKGDKVSGLQKLG